MLFPKHIDRWLFGMINFRIWPISLSFLQLILLVVWASLSFAVMNGMMKSGISRGTSMISSSPILLIFAFVAFFKISEMSLLPFIAKLVRTYMLNTSRKFQVNFIKNNNIDIMLSKFKIQEKKEIINFKKISDTNLDFYNKIKQDGLVY